MRLNTEVVGLRDGLARFVSIMEQKLRANSYKGGWSNCSIAYLRRRLGEEKAELLEAIRTNAPKHVVEAEAADVANFCMMLADIYEPKVN